MFKRLALSLVLMGLAAFSLGAGAVAWFSDSATGNVTISAGTPNLEFEINQDCDGDIESPEGEVTSYDFDWNGIVPGDSTQDCITVFNKGDGTLTVYIAHSNFGGDNALRNATTWEYNAIGTGSVNCNASVPHDAQYTTGRGCELDTIAPGESFDLTVDVAFADSGTNQNGLSSLSFTMDAVITGYTG